MCRGSPSRSRPRCCASLRNFGRRRGGAPPRTSPPKREARFRGACGNSVERSQRARGARHSELQPVHAAHLARRRDRRVCHRHGVPRDVVALIVMRLFAFAGFFALFVACRHDASTTVSTATTTTAPAASSVVAWPSEDAPREEVLRIPLAEHPRTSRSKRDRVSSGRRGSFSCSS